MTQPQRSLAVVACLAVVAALLGGAVAAPYATLPLAFNGVADFKLFGEVCAELKLPADGWFKSGYLEAIIYVPNNAAMKKMLGAKTPKQWVAHDKAFALKVVLQHVVSSATLNNWRSAYNNQKHSSLLTLVNHGAKLTVGINGNKRTVSSEVTKANVVGSATVKVGKHNRATLVPIDAVLMPGGAAPAPTYKTVWDVITKLPGLEDLHAITLRALTVNPGLKAQLSDASKTVTFFAPNAAGMGFLVEVLSKARGVQVNAQTILNDAKLCDRMVRYLVATNVKWNAEELFAHRSLKTMLAGHNLRMQFFHGHEIVASDFPVRNRGKFVNYMPKSFGTVMKGVPQGSWDMPVGKKIMVHVFDSFLVPKN